MAPDVAVAEEDFKYYFVRALEEATTTPNSRLHALVNNSCALLLGYFILRTVRDFANKVIDHVLLNNFPVLSSQWCIVQEGQNASLLRERQKYYMRLACLATGLLWWLGGYLCGVEVVECVRYIIILYTTCQLFVVSFLLFIHGLIWFGFNLVAFTEWDPSGTGEKEINGKGDEKTVHFDTASTPKYRGSNMPRKHPSSVGMGRFLRSLPQGALAKANFYSPRKWKQTEPDEPELNSGKQQKNWNKYQQAKHPEHHQKRNFEHHHQLQPEKYRVQQPIPDLFITREYNSTTHQTETLIYHPITTREKYWDTSFEELRVEHYLTCQKFVTIQVAPEARPPLQAPLITLEITPPSNPSAFTATTSTFSSFSSAESEEQEEEEQTENSISDLLKSSIRQIALPSWLSSRMSRDDRTKTATMTTTMTTTNTSSPISFTDDGESSLATTLVASSTPPGLPPASVEWMWGRRFT
ncbi:hypothetical protein CERZMDRAFT_101428 [Cercospora zeae-maydis SCOH1-5]|uniref:Uncharacterized protein n=1 Tax=Cercospora zeae-maydis SCOH1-5 TaxID=717836 RepID=A0A6A6F6X6_9PEZI|nr:hypothetical protein CERZMDRAFT_101428 [Cercospora zeae-maydis SCOH1-5]